MKAIFKREFLSLFRRLYAYIVVSLLLIGAAASFMAYNLTYTGESIVNLLSFMTVLSALVIPVLANAIYPSRKKADSDAIYGAMPVSVRDIVLGKYFAALCVLMLPNILLAVFPTIAGMLGHVDHIVSYSTLLGFMFFEAAWLSVCMYIANAAKSRVRSYIYSYVLIVIWYFADIVNILIPTTPLASLIGIAVIIAILSLVLYLCTKKLVLTLCTFGIASVAVSLSYIFAKARFAGLCESLIDTFSIFWQYKSFTYGLFNLEGIIYFSVIILLFSFLTWRSYNKKYQNAERFTSFNVKSSLSLGLAVLFIASSLALTCACAVLPDRFLTYDATLAKKNSVSEKAEDYLKTVDKDITIYLLEPTGLEDYELYLERLTALNSHFNLKKIYNSSNPEFYVDRNINVKDITANSLFLECGANRQYISYLNLFYYSNKTLNAPKMSISEYNQYYQIFASNEQYIENLQSLVYETEIYFNADNEICSCIEYITADIIPTSYYLVGNGEKPLGEVGNVYAEYGFTEIDIEQNEIPADAASILINMPTEDISDTEKQKLLNYLSRGGQLTFVTSSAQLKLTNLCAVLSEYGMSASNEEIKQYIPDENDEQKTTLTNDVEINVDTSNDIFYVFDGANISITLKNANPITVDESKLENLINIPLVFSTDEAFTDDKENTATYMLGCAVETPNGAKLAWFTGGESFNDAASEASILSAYTSIYWTTLQYKSAVTDIPAVLYGQATSPVSSGAVGFLKIIFVLIPISVATTGGILFYRRIKSKQNEPSQSTTSRETKNRL